MGAAVEIQVLFIEPDGRRVACTGRPGQSLLELAHDTGVDLEGACGACLACATCHVILDPAWLPRLPPPTPEEEDMLDLAVGVAPESRLGCQIRLTPALDGLVVRVGPR